MRLPGSPSDVPPDPSDRLNGWKEIASFLGKGVRTVQRWEKDLGLPVHRLGKEGGEIIFALKSEVQQWTLTSRAQNGVDDDAHSHAGNGNGLGTGDGDQSATASTTPPSIVAALPPTRRRLGRAAALGLTFLAAILLVCAWRVAPMWTVRNASAATRQPFTWNVEDDRLRVFDTNNELLWEHRFAGGFAANNYYVEGHLQVQLATVADLDGDGNREVVFVGGGLPIGARRLYVFNHDGSERFTHLPAPTVHFGTTEYAPHWSVRGATVTRDAAGHASIWVWYIHGMWFPTLLQQLDPGGRVLSDYWSNGYIEFVGTGTWRGRPVVLVGGTDNDQRGASLAIFDGLRLQGSAPAVRPDFECTDCAPGHPAAFVVFPRTCLLEWNDGQPYVNRAWIDSGDRVVALVAHGSAMVNGQGEPADTFYTLRPDLTPERIELTREYMMVHAAHERGRHVDHTFGPADEKDFFPLLRWDGDRFTAMPAAPVRR